MDIRSGAQQALENRRILDAVDAELTPRSSKNMATSVRANLQLIASASPDVGDGGRRDGRPRRRNKGHVGL
ncbi:MAG: hypothetical protein ABJF01_25295 [bacterium]